MEQLVQMGKILSDENRIKIIALINRETEVCVCEICDTLQLSQPLVSRHLKQMRQAGIVNTQQNGKWILYSLCRSPLLRCVLEEIHHIKLPKLIACAKDS